MTKHIFVTGGVVSGLGKGITASALGRLLKERGLAVAAQKIDPYVNIDPGTMSPYQHGEVFVTEDGAETDLDLGHYERFIDEDLTKLSTITTGRVYWNVLTAERSGAYLGETVQVIPHVTNEIKRLVYAASEGKDVLITEIGGTVGDIESQPFLEAIRQISLERGRENCLFVHVTLVPYLAGSEEYKTKPTQHSVKELRNIGILPNIIVLRCDGEMDSAMVAKIALFCNVKTDCVIKNKTVSTLYEVPIDLEEQNFSDVVCRELGIHTPKPNLHKWNEMVEKIKNRQETVNIALVGKYVRLHDAYLSVIEALNHGGFENGVKVCIKWIDSEKLTPETVSKKLQGIDGIIIPGGFGGRGVAGMVEAVKFARENKIPFFGICLGLQIAVIEYARNVCGISDADSYEFNDSSKNLVINYMPGQHDDLDKGGTMRLGKYPCRTKENSTLRRAYGVELISERHRHRFEYINDFRQTLESAGLIVSGESPDGNIVEAVEIQSHEFFVGVQFHPEFKSRPNRPHPLFSAFIKAAAKKWAK
ncbi:MAG: CTP synthase [Clostridiales bacterium]|jgi:CTP synthase|nr:CTP synthase [Clostridiales bacterium]